MVRSDRIEHAGNGRLRGILSSKLFSSEAEVLFIQHTQITFHGRIPNGSTMFMA